jgi:hypothetical protein
VRARGGRFFERRFFRQRPKRRSACGWASDPGSLWVRDGLASFGSLFAAWANFAELVRFCGTVTIRC